jgi:SAM-dependent methyltransferase
LEAPFHGWDLSWLESRKTTTFVGADNPMEIYDARAAVLVAQSTAVLDLGTGDGNRFAAYAPFPEVAFATESHAPNVSLAAERLAAMGVQVVWADPNCHNSRGPRPGNRWPERRLPFADQTFDLVLASRSAFSPKEVARILRPGGTVLTIQGGSEWRGETLADALCGTPPEWTQPGSGWDVDDSFLRAGFHIVDWIEHAWTTTYRDIAVVAYELMHVPWSIVDFDVERYRERLFALHRRMQAEGGFLTRGYTRLIEARKR